MEILKVQGGKKLFGRVSVPAAKNSTLPIIAASLMLDGETQISRCPKLADIYSSIDIINYLDSCAALEKDTLSVFYKPGDVDTISLSLCQKMRSAILYVAPMLYRKGKISFFCPGGCTIGKRPIDIHIDGLTAMGAEFEQTGDIITAKAPNGFKGAIFKLKLPSVGATQTLMMAAVVAEGVTVLKNCAKEPEIVDLARFLNSAGAKIMGAGKGEIVIKGVPCLQAVQYTPIPDRIFAATILSAVSACTGACIIQNYPQEYMQAFEKQAKKTGLCITHFLSNAYVFKFFEKQTDIETHTGYYPGFPTDMGPLLASAMVNNTGTLKLRENIFENRFSYGDAFSKLGLYCKVTDKDYYQIKQKNVPKAILYAEDLRAGAAIVVAAIAKKGAYTIFGTEYIDRGYEKIEKIFSTLGADIRREIVD